MNENDSKLIHAKLDLILAAIAALSTTPAAQAATSPAVVADIDGPHGDPEIRFDPKRWEGKSYKGLTFSQVTFADVGLLDMLADAFDYFARKNDENEVKDNKGGPKSKWDRLDAARARAWAARIRERGPRKPRAAAAPPDAVELLSSDDIPF